VKGHKFALKWFEYTKKGEIFQEKSITAVNLAICGSSWVKWVTPLNLKLNSPSSPLNLIEENRGGYF
jgi:hypothetical protein